MSDLATRIAVLMTCHNRRSKTLACLESLFGQELSPTIELRIYLVDDGSTDGTSNAVQNSFPAVKVITGSGNLFWNGGMRQAFKEAIKSDFDYHLWVNDDTIFKPDAVRNLLQTHQLLINAGSSDSIVVGSVQDPISGALTYGGLTRPSCWRRLKFELVETKNEPQECETMNGNCVLIPRSVVEKVGNLSESFTHMFGDIDYGLRARKLGCSVWIAPGYIGNCTRNPSRGSWSDVRLSLREKFTKINDPKGLPPLEWKTYARNHAGPFWFLYWLSPYVRVCINSMLKRVYSRS